MKKILILGSGGFVGGNLLNSFILDQLEVHQIRGKRELDIRDENLYRDYIIDLKPEVVINCAANVGGIDYSRGREIELLNDNFKIGLSVLEGMRSLPNSTLITPIPNCIYPGHLSFYRLEDLWNGEVHDSVKSYGIVKRVYTEMSRIYSEQSDFDYCNLIFPNIYGPGDHLEEKRAHALGALIYKSLIAKQNLMPFMEIWGSGNPIREWLYIDDALKFIKQAIFLGLKNKSINCGSGQTISIRDLASLINKFTMYTGELRFDRDKRDGALVKKMDSTLSEELLSYKAKYTLEDGIRETVKWYVNVLGGDSNRNL